jgi:hypothetical protein
MNRKTAQINAIQMKSLAQFVTMFSLEWTPIASKGVHPMLRKTMIVLAMAAALTGGLTADAFAIAAGHGGPFGEFTVQSIGDSDARSQPATESHGGNAERDR